MEEYPLVGQRTGLWSQLVCIPETAWDTDPGAPLPFVLPLADAMEFNVDQPIEAAPVYVGDALPPQTVDMNLSADMSLPLALEFKTIGRLLKAYFTANGYFQPEGATGKLHRFKIPTVVGSRPISFQLLAKHLEATAQYERATGFLWGGFSFPFMTAGRSTYTATCMGSGTYLETSLGGAPTSDGYVPASYFNYRAVINDILVVGLTDFTIEHTNNIARTDVGGRQGKAGAITTGFYGASGSIATIYGLDGDGIESNANFNALYTNKTVFPVECLWADLPGDLATKYLRQRFFVRIGKPKKSVGGSAGLVQTASWQLVRSSDAKFAGEVHGNAKGPYTIPASGNLGVKVDGGGTITVSLTAGSRTLAQVVTELNADVTFAADAVASNFLGFLMITSKTTGSTSSIQIDGTVLNTAHTALGLPTTAYAGYSDTPLIVDLWNDYGAAY